jgi:hypothetical protein
MEFLVVVTCEYVTLKTLALKSKLFFLKKFKIKIS